MARFARVEVLYRMIETGLVSVFYQADVEVAKKIAAAVFAGGCPFLEFTNRGDHAWEVFSELEKYCAKALPSLILGAGSVVDPGYGLSVHQLRSEFRGWPDSEPRCGTNLQPAQNSILSRLWQRQ